MSICIRAVPLNKRPKKALVTVPVRPLNESDMYSYLDRTMHSSQYILHVFEPDGSTYLSEEIYYDEDRFNARIDELCRMDKICMDEETGETWSKQTRFTSVSCLIL